MPLPTIASLDSLDTVVEGAPFVSSSVKVTINTGSLDYVVEGAPFFGQEVVATTATTILNVFIM